MSADATTTLPAPADTALETPKSIWRERVRMLLRSAPFLFGIAILIFWVVMAIIGPVIVPMIPTCSIR
jgi:hypothetical protein